MGNCNFNQSVSYKFAFFEKPFKPTLEEQQKIGSKYISMILKAQINALKLMMNKAYLILINVSLYFECIIKFISPSFFTVCHYCFGMGWNLSFKQVFVGINNYENLFINRKKTKSK